MEKRGYIYIVANGKNGTIYTGVTSNLPQRIYQHRHHLLEGFTKKYDVTQLVYYEVHPDINHAIRREKRLKKYTRKAKLVLVEKNNPEWQDLYEQLGG